MLIKWTNINYYNSTPKNMKKRINFRYIHNSNKIVDHNNPQNIKEKLDYNNIKHKENIIFNNQTI